MWLIFVVNKLRWIKVNFEVKMKRFNSKLFYCLLYLIPTVLFSEDAGNSSICYLQEWGVGSMTSKLRSKFLMTSAASRILLNCTCLASFIFFDVTTCLSEICSDQRLDSNWEFWFIMLWNEWSSSTGIGNDFLTETNLLWNYLLFLNCLGPCRSLWWHWIWNR